ncbi:Very-long-chain (3R)-3-hydroxyacyl-CoA dehydratase [Pleurostoma richardsiae]|uniref:Very-long-chain (3R)-3-hydroxyacyl-CoA dehydratase n=1 Tax=Pleurostoma richardsiae TaxID=41990 RepID=A0AA38RMS5_9PEZI|nr:Very-long-chain (3R)-3-hydroxyacyl-CoA dehydratase [Pleurostoma richardsiae]
MKKTLLLCFIHGFKGGESTFGDNYAFTEHLRQLVAKELPKIDVKVLVYPKFETRGDLGDCVNRFRDWLLEKVIDLEVAAGTPSPTVDPSVRTVLVGHSMGGIVAAETVIAITSDKPIPAGDSTGATGSPPPSPGHGLGLGATGLMFPYIQGVLAFDTPYLGISPGVVAHGAEGHYTAASSALTELSGLAGALWGGGKAAEAQHKKDAAKPVAALPAPPAKKADGSSSSSAAAAPASPWERWGKIAMYAGAAGAVAAGGAAAWLKRDQISEGWTWAYSHLEFVGCLAKGEDLRRRVGYMVRANRELGIGFGNLYTRLGRAAAARQQQQAGVVGVVLGSQRTFCNLPSKQAAGDWRPAVNDAAKDETLAHMSMFEPKENPGYEKLAQDATQMITSWTRNDWYESSGQEQLF